MFLFANSELSFNNNLALEDYSMSEGVSHPTVSIYFHDLVLGLGRDFVMDSLRTVLDTRAGIRLRIMESSVKGKTAGRIDSQSASNIERSPFRHQSIALAGAGLGARTLLGPHSIVYGGDYYFNLSGQIQNNITYEESPSWQEPREGRRISGNIGYLYETKSGIRFGGKFQYTDYRHVMDTPYVDKKVIILEHKKGSLSGTIQTNL
jgi:hypothetical protein